MAERVCPWWAGYLLASPIRRWLMQSPEDMLAPFVQKGMTVLEPGPGMGFFTLPLAQMVGPTGRIIAVDIQTRMLASLERRAVQKGLADRIEKRLATSESMPLDDLKGAVDFVLAFAVVHELPSAEVFFRQTASVLKPGALVFLAEPSGHVNSKKFQQELVAAQMAGLEAVSQPTVRRSLTTILRRV